MLLVGILAGLWLDVPTYLEQNRTDLKEIRSEFREINEKQRTEFREDLRTFVETNKQVQQDILGVLRDLRDDVNFNQRTRYATPIPAEAQPE